MNAGWVDESVKRQSRTEVQAVEFFLPGYSLDPASPEDIPSVMELVAAAILKMNEKGIYQWSDEYPAAGLLRSDAEEGNLFLLHEGGSLAGIMVLNESASPEYAAIPWTPVSGPILVIHRLCIHPAYQGRSLARGLVSAAVTHARINAYTAIRLDAYTANPAALKLYESSGFTCRGQVWFSGRSLPFNCYELLVTAEGAGV